MNTTKKINFMIAAGLTAAMILSGCTAGAAEKTESGDMSNMMVAGENEAHNITVGKISEIIGNMIIFNELEPMSVNPPEDGEQTKNSNKMVNGGAERTYKDEDIEIIVPAGTPVMEMSFSEDGAKETEIKLETLKSGDMIMVTYASDGKTIEKVTKQPGGVMKQGQGQKITFGENGGGGMGQGQGQVITFGGNGNGGGSQ
ncbi:MAG: hypothetical protein FWG90_10680 [Oscillospiraceae bacterium]|nr:hypothetical protein [Oscillospiraceae bacterium]